MIRFRQLCMAVVLTLMLGTYAFAGIIDTPPAPPDPPPPASAPDSIEAPPSGAQPGSQATDPVVDIALDLLQAALLLF
jgi:hypothetical protein